MAPCVCRACGAPAVRSVPLPAEACVEVEHHFLAGASARATAHTCHVCGDHRVSVLRLTTGAPERTDVHPVAGGPTLRRVCHVATMSSGEVTSEWTHFVDDIEVAGDYWRQRLDDRRRVRRAKVCN